MSNYQYNNKWIWITGASSGIGKALAIQYAKKSANLILSARNESVLLAVKEACKGAGEVMVLPLDLSNTNSLETAYSQLKKHEVQLDVLINNGGISQRGLVRSTDMSVHRKLIEVNYIGSVYLTTLVLPDMIAQGNGHIVGISSIVGQFGFPLRSSYSASKHALKGFLETLYLEESKNGIDVSIVYPGRINTEISKHALDENGKSTEKMDDSLAKGMDVNECAKKIISGIEKKKVEIFVGKRELLLLFIRRYTPAIFFKIAKNIKPV